MVRTVGVADSDAPAATAALGPASPWAAKARASRVGSGATGAGSGAGSASGVGETSSSAVTGALDEVSDGGAGTSAAGASGAAGGGAGTGSGCGVWAWAVKVRLRTPARAKVAVLAFCIRCLLFARAQSKNGGPVSHGMTSPSTTCSRRGWSPSSDTAERRAATCAPWRAGQTLVASPQYLPDKLHSRFYPGDNRLRSSGPTFQIKVKGIQ